jgi:hypothetical protein
VTSVEKSVNGGIAHYQVNPLLTSVLFEIDSLRRDYKPAIHEQELITFLIERSPNSIRNTTTDLRVANIDFAPLAQIRKITGVNDGDIISIPMNSFIGCLYPSERKHRNGENGWLHKLSFWRPA